ncbi:MAG: DNA alkylation repair protein [Lachnospiraceae bacterium]|nr:DNA alkylation repair protein [Lachnospiraceae bacterium]
MDDYMSYLMELIPERDSLKLVKTEAKKYYQSHSIDDCYAIGIELYQSDNFQIQEVGVFLLGYTGHHYPEALTFLKDTVSKHDSWKVQEILAMAFDVHCKTIGYQNALPLIREWLSSDCANVRRAVSEGLRVWTSRPYFKENPLEAIELLAAHKEDDSEYVRKSIGNALRDISKKFPDLVQKELDTWDLDSKKMNQVYKLASRYLKEVKDL